LSETDRKPKKSLEGTAGSENPRYVMLWTSEEKLSLMAQELSRAVKLDAILPLSPSSTIVFEFVQGSSGDLNIQTFINDQQVDTYDCDFSSQCKASAFRDVLKADLDRQAMNVTQFCGGTEL